MRQEILLPNTAQPNQSGSVSQWTQCQEEVQMGRTLTVCQETLWARSSIAKRAYFSVANQEWVVNTARPNLAGILPFFASLVFPTGQASNPGSGIICADG